MKKKEKKKTRAHSIFNSKTVITVLLLLWLCVVDKPMKCHVILLFTKHVHWILISFDQFCIRFNNVKKGRYHSWYQQHISSTEKFHVPSIIIRIEHSIWQPFFFCCFVLSPASSSSSAPSYSRTEQLFSDFA